MEVLGYDARSSSRNERPPQPTQIESQYNQRYGHLDRESRRGRLAPNRRKQCRVRLLTSRSTKRRPDSTSGWSSTNSTRRRPGRLPLIRSLWFEPPSSPGICWARCTRHSSLWIFAFSVHSTLHILA